MTFRCKTIRQLIDEASAPPRNRPGNVTRARRKGNRPLRCNSCPGVTFNRARVCTLCLDRLAVLALFPKGVPA